VTNYIVKYVAGTYSGERFVVADHEFDALRQVRAWVRKEMTIPMYADSYRVREAEAQDDDEPQEDDE
jgi:hypothetical protein